MGEHFVVASSGVNLLDPPGFWLRRVRRGFGLSRVVGVDWHEGSCFGVDAMNAVMKEVRSEQVTFPSEGVELVATLFLPEEPGRYPAMILCHGAGEFKEHYEEFCRYLAERGVVALAVDMRGHGGSGGDRFHVEIPDWVEDVRAAVDFLAGHEWVDGDKIGAFGLSSGGTAILEAALEDPRLRALVLLDATVRNSMPWVNTVVVRLLVWCGWVVKLFTGRSLRLPILKMFGNVKLVSDAELEAELLADPRTLEAFLSFPFPGAAQSFFVDTIRRVSGVSVPTLVIWGAEDELDPPETARLIFDELSCEKRLEIVEGNGHAGHLDRNRVKVFQLATDWALTNLV